MSEFDGDKLKAGLQAWAEKNQISINQFRKYMDYTYAYSWDLLRGRAIFSAKAFGRFVLAFGMEAGQELMQLAGYPDALPRPAGAQAVPVVYVGVEEEIGMSDQTSFDNYCIVELFGHQKIAGRVTEQVIAGQGFIRVDVPETKRKPIAFTRLFGPNAIYSITPVSAEIAQQAAEAIWIEPITVYFDATHQLEEPMDGDE